MPMTNLRSIHGGVLPNFLLPKYEINHESQDISLDDEGPLKAFKQKKHYVTTHKQHKTHANQLVWGKLSSLSTQPLNSTIYRNT